MFISIDPGTRATGWAVWKDEKLYQCGIARGKDWVETVNNMPRVKVTKLCIEDQQIYRNSEVNAHSLIAVARVVGAIVIKYQAKENKIIKPREWKGQVPKTICNKRTLQRLTEEEIETLTRKTYSKSMIHNLLDAVGIGLWELKRRR